ncbi:MAG: YfhO family protein [Ignavibacteriales bacterium]|nr:YfhO family protein [Ignavibacteriales bacterium]
MSKSKERSASRQSIEQHLIPPRYQHLAAVGLVILSLIVFFREPIFGGKVFLASDNIASHSFDTLLADARSEGVFPLWNPYIFCGMPAYGSLTLGGDRPFDLSSSLFGLATRAAGTLLLNPAVGWVIFYYIIFATGMYLLAWQKTDSKIASAAVSLAATYSVFIIIWIMVGHNTKIAVMAMFPYIVLVVEQLRREFQWLLFLILTLLLHFSFVPGHVQMIFYVYLAIGGYLLFFFLRGLLKKEDWKGPLRTAAVLLVASGIAFAMDADKYLSVLEYNPHSIRGSNPITASLQRGADKTAEGGLDYEYATNWSLGVGETFTAFVPSLYGFGNVEYRGPLTNNQPTRLPLYFGPQPFTDAPQYMGIVVLILAFVGFWRFRNDPFVQYLALMIGFSFLVAYGKEFPPVYDLMYNYFPTFNKFRVPSMILVLVQIMVPILAGYGLLSFFRQRDHYLTADQDKRWKYLVGALAALFVLSFIGKDLFRSIYESLFPFQTFAQHLGQRLGVRNVQVAQELYDVVVNMVLTDLRVAFGLLLVVFGSLFLFLRRSMKLSTLSAVILLAIVIDLWRVNTKPMETHEKRAQENMFTASPAIQAILAQEGGNRNQTSFLPPFRVLEFENGVPPFNNTLAYWRLQSAYGYQGAKMRRYQDLADVVGLGNPLLWQLMNVKYIVTNQADSSRFLGLLYDSPNQKVYVNRIVLPRAFFVNRYEVADGLDVLKKMNELSFDPRDVAYLAEDPDVKIGPLLPGMEATFVRYGIQDFTIKTKTQSTSLLFLSESYYPEGWKAFIDGEEIRVYRANYHFRAVIVPEGEHTLEMKFEPRGFNVGKTLSLAANILVLGGFGVVGWNYWRRRTKV